VLAVYRAKFLKQAEADYLFWAKRDRAVLERIDRLVGDLLLHPFEGIGKPEPLKGNLRGYWSRRIDAENRLVYAIKANGIIEIRTDAWRGGRACASLPRAPAAVREINPPPAAITAKATTGLAPEPQFSTVHCPFRPEAAPRPAPFAAAPALC
jgi:toxin YoeB